MNSPQQTKKANPNRGVKRNHNQPSAPPQKDAYARLLSQHRSTKFSLYLEEYAKHSSSQREGNSSNLVLQGQSDGLHVAQQKIDRAPIDFSDSGDFSTSSLKNKGEESSLSSYMEKLSTRGAQQESERKHGVSERQRRGPRRDTATSQDGDIESGEEPGRSKPNSAKKHQKQQRKKEGAQRNISSKEAESFSGVSQSPMKVGTSPEEQEKMKKSKKKKQPKHTKEEKTRDVTMNSGSDAQTSGPKTSYNKDKKLQQPTASQTNSPADKSKKKGDRSSKKPVFEPYMTLEEVYHGLQEGTLLQGQLRINSKKYTEAFVPPPDDTHDIFLDGIVARNRALNGDIVVIQILPQEQWKVMKSETDVDGASEAEARTNNMLPTAQRKTEGNLSSSVNVEDQCRETDELNNKCQNVSLSDPGEPSEDHPTLRARRGIIQKTAKVVYILQKKHSRTVTGLLKFLPDKPFAMFSPVDHRVPRINVPLTECPSDLSSRPGDYSSTLFICKITNWAADSNFAEGQLVKTLGKAGEIEPETEAILVETEVDFSEFSEEVLDCLPKNLPWTIPPEEIEKRRDLRKECIFTIDPASARDMDDALSCKQLPDGNFEVGVHIADVSYFVEEGSALDAIASNRATSVYLVQNVIPMLPRLLCEELCSLNPHCDRLTLSVIWKFTPEGKILSQWFGRSVIRSCVKLSYDHAQSLIEAPEKLFPPEELPPVDPEHSIDEIHQAVLNMHSISKKLRAEREGSLKLEQIKLCFALNKETKMPQGCYIHDHKDSNILVEEFMLKANMATAHHIYEHFPELALLRRHPPPKPPMIEELEKLLRQLGFDIDCSSAGALQNSLSSISGENSRAKKHAFAYLLAKPMQMALYFCSGVLKGKQNYHHYALNVPLYTHFTSPIRRYPDIIVHRLLASSLGCGPALKLSAEEMQKQTTHCNDKKTLAKRASELSTDLYFGVFLKTCGTLQSEAMVMQILDMSFDVLVLRYGVQKRIYFKLIADLDSFHLQKVGEVSHLRLVWKSDDPKNPPVEQIISHFSMVEVELKTDGASLKYKAELKRPDGC